MKLRCSRAIVTGGEPGIGRAIAKRLIVGGDFVAIADDGDKAAIL